MESIQDKVCFILMAAKNRISDDQTLALIDEFAKEHSHHPTLGRVFGYSVSDYAIAALRWIETKESMEIFNKQYEALPRERKMEVDQLIKSEIHKEL